MPRSIRSVLSQPVSTLQPADITGVILTVASVLSETIGVLFSNQYIRVLKLTSDCYSKVVVYESMNNVIDYILELPETDNSKHELRYLEFRECVRPVMKGFAEMLKNVKS